MCGHFNLQNIELNKMLFYIIIILIIVDIFRTILLILSFDQIIEAYNFIFMP